MKMSSMVGMCSAMALCLAVGTAQAGPNPGAPTNAKVQKAAKIKKNVKPQVASLLKGQRVDPIKSAGIRKMADGTYKLTTPWMAYTGAGNDVPDTLFYDSAQVDASGAPVGGSECGVPDGNRYLLECNAGKRDYNNPYATWWMDISKDFAGKPAAQASLHWYWTAAGNGTYYVAVFTSEDVSEDCSLPSEANTYDGVVLGFADNLGSGYFYTVYDGTADGLSWTMPSDGHGGIIEILADFFDGTNLTLAAGPSQPMLWGTSNNGGLPDRPGTSGDPTWSDDGGSGGCSLTPDGVHAADECYTYVFGACPDPFTNMIAFFGEAGGNACYPDCNGDGSLDLFDFLCFTNDFNVGGKYSDCNADTKHDLFDFLCFVNAFNTGC